MEKSTIKEWVQHGEWASLMATVLACFLFVHHENGNSNTRLDKTIYQMQESHTQIHKRMDEQITSSNKRADDLHREFYELLKENRK